MNKAMFSFAVAAIAIVAIFLFDRKVPKETAMTMQQKLAFIPGDLDYSRTRTSVDKKYIISISSLIEPVPLNQIHQWEITIKTQQGDLVDAASVSITGGMPMHKHGLPTAPRMTQDLGQGRYLIEGMKFSMAGWWEIIIEVAQGFDKDKATFNLILR
jgi:hypothetical protein